VVRRSLRNCVSNQSAGLTVFFEERNLTEKLESKPGRRLASARRNVCAVTFGTRLAHGLRVTVGCRHSVLPILLNRGSDVTHQGRANASPSWGCMTVGIFHGRTIWHTPAFHLLPGFACMVQGLSHAQPSVPETGSSPSAPHHRNCFFECPVGSIVIDSLFLH
jgi:hypothetical protein